MAHSQKIDTLEIEYRSLDALKPDPRNARTHSRKQIDQIAASITAFGFTNPILIDPQLEIIAGHGRLRAAKQLQILEVPTITLKDLTEEEKRALRIADNKIALNAGWDMDLLKGELLDLSIPELGFDLSLTGFSAGEIDVVLDEGVDPQEDVIPAVPSEPRAKLGEIWQLGEHRIGCGDGRDLDFLQEVIGEGLRVDAAFLDPPYNVKISGHANSIGRHREFAMASGEMSEDAFHKFLNDTLGACAKVSRNGAVHFVCMDWRHADEVSQVAKNVYGAQLNICIWNKSNAVMGSL